MASTRPSLFQTLKPACVDLGETALKFRRGDASGQQLCASLTTLQRTLSGIGQLDRLAFDHRLAEYVFFPLSHVLRDRGSTPGRALELACQCLKVLLSTGWRTSLSPELGHQLMILLTFLASGSSGDAKQQTQKLTSSEDLQVAAFECEALLFKAVGGLEERRKAILATEKIPAIGHGISILLESIKNAELRDAGRAAVVALQSFLDHIATREVAASFLPGIVSVLSHVLTPSTKTRTPYRTLVAATSLLRKLLITVFATSTDRAALGPVVKSGDDLQPILDEAWFKANASQVRLALIGAIKLGKHDKREVRRALLELCLDLLSKCSTKLSDSIDVLLDASLYLVSVGGFEENVEQLQSLVLSNEHLLDSLRSTSYDLFSSLSRIMMTNDEPRKNATISKLITGRKILSSSEADNAYLDSVSIALLRDGLGSAISLGFSQQVSQETLAITQTISVSELINDAGHIYTAFAPVLTGNEQVVHSVEQMRRLVSTLGSTGSAVAMARQSLMYARESEGNDSLTSLWLSVHLLKSNMEQQLNDFELLALDSDLPDFSAVMDELFSHSLAIITDALHVEKTDWRSRALALEAVALNAQYRKEDFRDELVDVLYSVVHLLGSPVENLRNHAIACMNSIALSCGYRDARDLLVSNSDYIVNAIGLKFDSFDLSPQVSQVLSMTITLAGPSLIPYLDDVVESIFTAMDYFHEYTLLTEVLFTSLSAVVNEGVKTPPFAIGPVEARSHKKQEIRSMGMTDIKRKLRVLSEKQDARKTVVLPDETPHEPWNGTKLPSSEPSNNEQQEVEAVDDKDKKSPTSRTYETIKRIAILTQHHLPSSSPSLRMSLLQLLTKSLPFLSSHEDSFLPLVHILWPVLEPRLEDPEAYVVAGVMNVFSTMCEGAGDFMSSRISDLWPTVRRLYRMTKSPDSARVRTRGALVPSKETTSDSRELLTDDAGPANINFPASPSSQSSAVVTLRISGSKDETIQPQYQATTVKLLQRSLTAFLVQLLLFVRMSDAMVNEIINSMLSEAIQDPSQEDVREALKRRNPDALWLIMESTRFRARPPGLWSSHRPSEVDGAPSFAQVAF